MRRYTVYDQLAKFMFRAGEKSKKNGVCLRQCKICIDLRHQVQF